MVNAEKVEITRYGDNYSIFLINKTYQIRIGKEKIPIEEVCFHLDGVRYCPVIVKSNK